MWICNHNYLYIKDYVGLMDYGGTIIYGNSFQNQCSNCGKLRWKIRGKTYQIVLKRKDNKNIQHQMQLL